MTFIWHCSPSHQHIRSLLWPWLLSLVHLALKSIVMHITEIYIKCNTGHRNYTKSHWWWIIIIKTRNSWFMWEIYYKKRKLCQTQEYFLYSKCCDQPQRAVTNKIINFNKSEFETSVWNLSRPLVQNFYMQLIIMSGQHTYLYYRDPLYLVSNYRDRNSHMSYLSLGLTSFL
jgi:hypothetical protein